MSDFEKKSIIEFKDAIKPYTLERPEKKPKENYVSVLILRELKSAARFTTDGIEANSAVIRVGGIEETVGKLFGRKQVASDRRKAKALQRTLISNEMSRVIGNDGWKGCTMKVNEMCQRCPECALFGSAASEEGVSITSRVMYDETYTIRALSAIVDEFFQNAPGDDYSKEPTSAIREPDFFKEGTLFPCVVTLKDATAEEVLFFLNITDRNSRYGATGTRFGKTQNHILGIYASHREGPSSLEVAKEIALTLAKQGLDKKDPDYSKKVDERLKEVMYLDTLPTDEIKAIAIDAFESLSNKQRINYLKFSEIQSSNILEDIRDDQVVKSILVDQIAKIGTFLSA
ncbi:MAG: type I-D CRISPR-associated protein Cas7/Csc2 [Methanotrichaceae archaeon]|nr:type I-D CRISPR-associated protein Cas7/Csc2 [Methanotrichaceae archaeon]